MPAPINWKSSLLHCDLLSPSQTSSTIFLAAKKALTTSKHSIYDSIVKASDNFLTSLNEKTLFIRRRPPPPGILFGALRMRPERLPSFGGGRKERGSESRIRDLLCALEFLSRVPHFCAAMRFRVSHHSEGTPFWLYTLFMYLLCARSSISAHTHTCFLWS